MRCSSTVSGAIGRRLNCRQRDSTVTGTFCGSVVASTNLRYSGGSSSVFSIALNAVAGEHVHFVDHEDLEAPLHRLVDRLLQQRLHLVHAAVGRRIELGVVDEAARIDVLARLAHTARRGRDAALPVRPLAVERLGQDARHRGLADAARAGEQVGVMQPLRGQRVFERLHHMLLPHHFAEGLRDGVCERARDRPSAHFRGLPVPSFRTRPRPSCRWISRTAAPSMNNTIGGDRHAHCARTRPPRTGPPASPGAAATRRTLRYCAQPVQPLRQFDPSVAPGRARAITGRRQEVGGRHPAHLLLLQARATRCRRPGTAAAADIAVVDSAFEAWAKLGIGISFRRVRRARGRDGADRLRPQDGSWSYVGRDVLNTRSPQERTMNFGWPLTTAYGHDTALHEIGHTLGPRARAPEPERGHHLEPRRPCSTYFKGPPNNWDDVADRMEHPAQDPAVADQGHDLGPGLGHGIPVRCRTDRGARQSTTAGLHAQGRPLVRRQGLGAWSRTPACGRRRRRH